MLVWGIGSVVLEMASCCCLLMFVFKEIANILHIDTGLAYILYDAGYCVFEFRENKCSRENWVCLKPGLEMPFDEKVHGYLFRRNLYKPQGADSGCDGWNMGWLGLGYLMVCDGPVWLLTWHYITWATMVSTHEVFRLQVRRHSALVYSRCRIR